MLWFVALLDLHNGMYLQFVGNKYPPIALLRHAEEHRKKAKNYVLLSFIEVDKEFQERWEEEGGLVYEWD